MMNNQTDDNPSIRYFNIYINFFYLIFGNIGNLFKIAFFLQKPLRSVPCTIYILSSTINDFLTLNNLPALQLLIYLYPNYHWIKLSVDLSNHQNQTTLLSYPPSIYDIFMCKLRSYLHMLSTDLSFQMLLFASINRFCSSYRRKKHLNYTCWFIRHFCDHPNVYKLCTISCLITALISIHHIFNFTIHSSSEGCIPQNLILWALWISLFHCFLLPILMIIFGILTLKYVPYLSIVDGYLRRLKCLRQHRHRERKHRFLHICSHCSYCQDSIKFQIDKQLTSMIIGEIFVTILTSLPYGTYVFYQLLRIIQRKTMIDPNESIWISLLIRATMYFEPTCGFYIYLMTLTTFRKRFFRIFIRNLLAAYNLCWRRLET